MFPDYWTFSDIISKGIIPVKNLLIYQPYKYHDIEIKLDLNLDLDIDRNLGLDLNTTFQLFLRPDLEPKSKLNTNKIK